MVVIGLLCTITVKIGENNGAYKMCEDMGGKVIISNGKTGCCSPEIVDTILKYQQYYNTPMLGNNVIEKWLNTTT